MEKTKKLFGYIVIAMIALSLFFAGMTMQSIRSFALDEGFRPSVEYKPAPSYTDVAVEGEDISEEMLVDLTLTPIKDVANGKTEEEMTSEEKADEQAILDEMDDEEKEKYQETKKEMRKAKDQVEALISSLKIDSTESEDKEAEELFGEAVLKAMDEVAKKISDERGSEIPYDRDVMVITDVFKADLGTVLTRLIEETKKSVKVTFAVDADIVLFRSSKTGTWKTLEKVEDSASNAPINAAGENNTTTVLMDEAEGVLVFQKVSADADKLMADKAEIKENSGKDNKPTTPAEEKCCKDCGKNCPFCKYLCKDGRCYCWTIYLVIALAVILLILIIALAVVKSKAKKVPDIQLPEEEEETVARKPQQPRNDEEDQQNQQNQQDQQGNQPRQ